MKYVLYATAEKGDGRVMKVGEYEEVEDIEIVVGMFDKDVVLTIMFDTEVVLASVGEDEKETH